MVEPIIFKEMKDKDITSLQEDQCLGEKVQVLLIILCNLATSALKIGNPKYAKVVLNHGRKMAKRVLGEGSYYEKLFKQKLSKLNKTKGEHGYNKSTHISYIEKEVDGPVLTDPAHNRGKMKTSLTKRSIKNSSRRIFSRNTETKDMRRSKGNKTLEKGNGNTSMTVINKSSKRKIFVDKQQEEAKEVEDRKPEPQVQNQVSQELLNEALEKVRKETEEKYEEKLKKMISDINLEHQKSLGKY